MGSEFEFNLSDHSTQHFYSKITTLFYTHNVLYISVAYFIIPKSFALRRVYIPEKQGAKPTTISHLKQCIS